MSKVDEINERLEEAERELVNEARAQWKVQFLEMGENYATAMNQGMDHLPDEKIKDIANLQIAPLMRRVESFRLLADDEVPYVEHHNEVVLTLRKMIALWISFRTKYTQALEIGKNAERHFIEQARRVGLDEREIETRNVLKRKIDRLKDKIASLESDLWQARNEKRTLMNGLNLDADMEQGIADGEFVILPAKTIAKLLPTEDDENNIKTIKAALKSTLKGRMVYNEHRYRTARAREAARKEGLRPIRDMEMSVRSTNCLISAGIKDASETQVMTDKQLLDIPYLGRRCLAEIREVCGPYTPPEEKADETE